MLKVTGVVVLVIVLGAGVFLALWPNRKPVVMEKAHDMKRALTPTPVVLSEAPDPKRKGECEADLQSANPNNLLLSGWKRYGAHVDVHVRSAYLRTELASKQQIDRAVRCVAADGRVTDQGIKQVFYRHARNDELVAVWENPGGFRMVE